MGGFDYKTPDRLSARLEFYRRFSRSEEPFYSWLQRKVRDRTSGDEDVLDIGTGAGNVWRELSRGFARLVLSDASAGMIAKAKVLAPPGAQFVVCGAERLPFPKDSFDVMTAFGVMYHVDDHRRAFRAIKDVLRPGGAFLMSSNDVMHLKELRDLVGTVNPAAGRSLIADQFPLTQAEKSLTNYFGDIEKQIFPSHLSIESSGEVVDYVTSTPASQYLDGRAVADLKSAVDRKIEENGGAWRVATQVGVLFCHAEVEKGRTFRRRPEECNFCQDRALERNKYWIKVKDLGASRLCLSLNQLYRGACYLILDVGRHVEGVEFLAETEYSQLMQDLRVSALAIRELFRPDHLNIEILGNAEPHVHIHIVPRYVDDERWGKPIWTSAVSDMKDRRLIDVDYEADVHMLRAKVNEVASEYQGSRRSRTSL